MLINVTDESQLPPMPLLCILSHRGVLCVFHVMYMKEGAPILCAAAEQLPNTQMSLFTVPQVPVLK
jgi:hypothetical protein